MAAGAGKGCQLVQDGVEFFLPDRLCAIIIIII
jgi:hypothetical protein